FEAGTRGVTQSKSFGRIEWQVAEVRPGGAVLEFPAPGAVARFEWTFDEIEGGTRIRQRVSLSGEQAHLHANSIGPALRAGIPEGMRKLCEAIEEAARNSASRSADLGEGTKRLDRTL